MTNQQLKAHCEDVIANPQDHLDWVVDIARVALASLESVPRGWLTWHAIPPTWTEPGGGGEYLAFHESKPERVNDDGTDSWPVYDAPPAPELKPVELPVMQVDNPIDGFFYRCDEVIAAIRAAGYEVKS